MSWARSLGLLVVAACGNASDAPTTGSAGSVAGSAGSASSAGSATITEAPLPGARGTTTIQATQPAKVIVLDEPKLDLPKQEAFQLIDPGTGPRAVLRYGRGTTPWTSTSTSDFTIRRLQHGTWKGPTTLPKFSTSIAFTPDAASPHRFTLRALPPVVTTPSPDVEDRLQQWHTLLEGRIATVELDDRGQIIRLGFNDDPTLARSAEARDLLYDTLGGILVPLPVEPVGIHASWRVVTVHKTSSVYAKITSTFTLIERHGTHWKLHARTQDVAEQQRVTVPGAPAGVNADLMAMFRGSEADQEVDSTRPLGASATSTAESRLHLQFTMPGAPPVDQMFELTGTLSLSVSP